jgi:hypothetical protein
MADDGGHRRQDGEAALVDVGQLDLVRRVRAEAHPEGVEHGVLGREGVFGDRERPREQRLRVDRHMSTSDRVVGEDLR